MSSTRVPTVVELEKYAKTLSFALVHFVPKEKAFQSMRYSAKVVQTSIQSTRVQTGMLTVHLDDMKRAMQPFMKDVLITVLKSKLTFDSSKSADSSIIQGEFTDGFLFGYNTLSHKEFIEDLKCCLGMKQEESSISVMWTK